MFAKDTSDVHIRFMHNAHPSTPTGLKVKMVYTCTVLIYQEHVTRVSIHTMVCTIHYPVYRWDYKSASSHYHAAFQHWPALGLRPITLSFPLLQGLILPLSTGRRYFIWMNLSNFRRNFINLIKSMWAGPLHHHPSLKTNKNSAKKTPSSRAWLVGIQESWENISKVSLQFIL